MHCQIAMRLNSWGIANFLDLLRVFKALAPRTRPLFHDEVLP